MKNEKPKLILSVDLDGIRAFYEKDKVKEDAFLQQGLPNAVDFFNKLNIKPTFFVVGKNALDFPKEHMLLKKFPVGNHGFSHKRFNLMSRSEKISEIRKSEDAIKKIIGKKPDVFRAPDYRIDYETFTLLKKMGYKADSSLIKVVFPFRYCMNYLKNQRLEGDCFEIPLTSTAIPFNGTTMINYGLERSKKILTRLSEKGILNINFHDRDFTNEKIPSFLFRNRENVLKITKEIIVFISNHFEVMDFNSYLLMKRK